MNHFGIFHSIFLLAVFLILKTAQVKKEKKPYHFHHKQHYYRNCALLAQNSHYLFIHSKQYLSTQPQVFFGCFFPIVIYVTF